MTQVDLATILYKAHSVTLSVGACQQLLVRMQWDIESDYQFVLSFHRPILQSANVFSWTMRFGVTSWSYCRTCGYRNERKQLSPIGPKFVCQDTVIVPCKSDCRYDCYRQRDLETQGISSQCGARLCLAATAAAAMGPCFCSFDL